MDDFQSHGITCCHCLVWDAQAVGGWLVGQQRLKTFKKKKVRTDGRIGNVGIFKFYIYIYIHNTIYIYTSWCSIQVLFQVIPEISSRSWEWNTAAGHLGMFVRDWNFWPCLPWMELFAPQWNCMNFIRCTWNTHRKFNISPLLNRNRWWMYSKAGFRVVVSLPWLDTIYGPCFPTCRQGADNSSSLFLRVQSCKRMTFISPLFFWQTFRVQEAHV